MLLRQIVHLIHGDLHKRRHLIDERPGAAGAGAVHTHFEAAGEKQELCVLAAQLDHHVCIGHELFHGDALGVHLLHEGQLQLVRKPHARRAGDGKRHALPGKSFRNHVQELSEVLRDAGEVAHIF